MTDELPKKGDGSDKVVANLRLMDVLVLHGQTVAETIRSMDAERLIYTDGGRSWQVKTCTDDVPWIPSRSGDS